MIDFDVFVPKFDAILARGLSARIAEDILTAMQTPGAQWLAAHEGQ